MFSNFYSLNIFFSLCLCRFSFFSLNITGIAQRNNRKNNEFNEFDVFSRLNGLQNMSRRIFMLNNNDNDRDKKNTISVKTK